VRGLPCRELANAELPEVGILRAVPERNAGVVRGIYAEWGKGNFRAGTDLYDAHILLVIRDDFPDAGVYVGPDEVRGYMRRFLADWTDAVIEAEDVRCAGDSVAVAVHQHATGSGSGASVDMRYWQAWTFRGGAVIRIESIKERAEALAAVGLQEESPDGA
jgi:ketosteroid isomerase-like protein